MKTFNVHEAKTNFSSILAIVATGEDVLVARAGTPVAVISAYRQPQEARQPGLFKGQIKLSDSLFAPMGDEFMQFFK